MRSCTDVYWTRTCTRMLPCVVGYRQDRSNLIYFFQPFGNEYETIHKVLTHCTGIVIFAQKAVYSPGMCPTCAFCVCLVNKSQYVIFKPVHTATINHHTHHPTFRAASLCILSYLQVHKYALHICKWQWPKLVNSFCGVARAHHQGI